MSTRCWVEEGRILIWPTIAEWVHFQELQLGWKQIDCRACSIPALTGVQQGAMSDAC